MTGFFFLVFYIAQYNGYITTFRWTVLPPHSADRLRFTCKMKCPHINCLLYRKVVRNVTNQTCGKKKRGLNFVPSQRKLSLMFKSNKDKYQALNCGSYGSDLSYYTCDIFVWAVTPTCKEHFHLILQKMHYLRRIKTYNIHSSNVCRGSLKGYTNSCLFYQLPPRGRKSSLTPSFAIRYRSNNAYCGKRINRTTHDVTNPHNSTCQSSYLKWSNAPYKLLTLPTTQHSVGFPAV
jgi:hypothetical protein